jgi:hypothetical protein
LDKLDNAVPRERTRRGPVLAKPEVDRIAALAGKAQRVALSSVEKAEMRLLVSKHNPIAMDLAWEPLLAGTFVLLGAYTLWEIGPPTDSKATAS